MSGRIVIVGAGIAGVSTAQALRSGGYDGEVVLIGDEPYLPYRRPPLSKEVLRGDKTADDIRIKKAEWFAAQNITLRTGVAATGLDLHDRALTLSDTSVESYDRLVLATGGEPRRLPGQGPDQTRVRVLRRLADVPDPAELSDAGRIVVVGGGLIGSELAASARELGVQVTLLEAADLPMPKMLPGLIGERYAALHRAEGVTLETGVAVARVEQDEEGATVTATDGRSWSAPLVFVSIGIDPSTELAEKAGLRVEDGIVVDRYGQTSVVGVYAVGDVANWPHPLGGRFRGEHWQGAQNQGTAVGTSLSGTPSKFREVPWAWSDQYGHTLQVAGWPERADDVIVDGSLEELDFIARFTREGTLMAVVGIGRPRDIRSARTQIAEELWGP